MPRLISAADVNRRKLLRGALSNAGLKYPGDLVHWIDEQNAKMVEEGKSREELLPVLSRETVKKFANGRAAASERIATVVDAFISKYNSREQRAAARALSSLPSSDGDEEGDDDDGCGSNDSNNSDGDYACGASAAGNSNKRRKKLDVSVIVRVTDAGVEYSSVCDSNMGIDRLKEIILHDLAKDLCSEGRVAKLRGTGGGKYTVNVTAVKMSTGKQHTSRHKARKNIISNIKEIGKLHAGHTGGSLRGTLKFIAGAEKVKELGFSCSDPGAAKHMTLKELLLVTRSTTKHCLRIHRELKKFGFSCAGSEKTLRAELSSRKVPVHGCTTTVGGSKLDITRRVDVCAVIRDHVANHIDSGAFVETPLNEVQVTVAFDAGSNIEKVGLLLSNTWKPMSEFNLAPLAMMQNSKKTKCDHRDECTELWTAKVAGDRFGRSLKSGCEEAHKSTFITASTGGSGSSYACLARVPHAGALPTLLQSPKAGCLCPGSTNRPTSLKCMNMFV